MTSHERMGARLRVAIVAAEPAGRKALDAALRTSPDVDVLAWADSAEPLLVLGTRADVCLYTSPPSDEDADRLRRHGWAIAVDRGDPVAAVNAVRDGGGREATRRPTLSERQRDVLVAYVSSSDLLPAVARRLGMDPETVKTHLRRIRAKYTDVGRPAPTRRDLYVRAVEDGVLPPPPVWPH